MPCFMQYTKINNWIKHSKFTIQKKLDNSSNFFGTRLFYDAFSLDYIALEQSKVMSAPINHFQILHLSIIFKRT
jgi:hypothetical protein